MGMLALSIWAGNSIFLERNCSLTLELSPGCELSLVNRLSSVDNWLGSLFLFQSELSQFTMRDRRQSIQGIRLEEKQTITRPWVGTRSIDRRHSPNMSYTIQNSRSKNDKNTTKESYWRWRWAISIHPRWNYQGVLALVSLEIELHELIWNDIRWKHTSNSN